MLDQVYVEFTEYFLKKKHLIILQDTSEGFAIAGVEFVYDTIMVFTHVKTTYIYATQYRGM
jgi:hypothetical protein